MALDSFHPSVRHWFERHFGDPTAVQAEAWPVIHSGQPALITAPTGSGKTLAAFLAAIDVLIREGLERGLEDQTRVLYVSPLKALSNDIHKNLEQPVNGIRDALLEAGLPDVMIRTAVRTGDTSQSQRQLMRRQPPHILVTTPESLYILLTSDSGREMLKTVESVIVDEIHALAGNKRGSHLLLSLQRLEALCGQKPVRIGLSATQKPIERMAEYLMGSAGHDCRIIDAGHSRERDLAIEIPGSPLEAVMANETWEEIYNRLGQLAEQHRTTLIFVNTRRLAERVAHHLVERLGEENVTAHHGSLAREHRLDAEQRLKAGRLKALVATASLELGIDIGDVDLVCQLGSPRAIAAFLQRVGRSGHAVGALPKGRLFPLSRDDLMECTAMLEAVHRDELDHIIIPEQPLDVLAQQIVAEVASREWEEQALYEQFRLAWPYRELGRETFTNVVRMLADGYATRRGRRGAYLHHDAVNGRLRARRGARLVAVTNGGAIPDLFDYEVILSPEGHYVGSLNEDFAFESLPGDIFQLGNTSYRLLKVEQGKVHVEDAQGQPPNIPFWFGEAPGRSDELSAAVSNLREAVSRDLEVSQQQAEDRLVHERHMTPAAARQLADYLAAAKAALTVIPSQHCIVFERFFDETGDMHFVIHAPFGSRINRAWGLALRKRFCRKFNFELQAAATEDNVVLSLGPTHSFPLEEVAGYLKANTVRGILIQALLDAPLFATRWRWNTNISLAVPRSRNGKRVPAQFQRNDAEDLVAVIFPDQLACLENIAGDREVPDHPLVEQTLRDCLYDSMDIEGLERVLERLASGEIKLVCRDLASPSPLSAEILNARPYAFLDDAPAEERRTLAVQQRRFTTPQEAAELGRLDAEAIERVRQEAWIDARTPDELHDALVVLGFVTESEIERGPMQQDGQSLDFGWRHLLDSLKGENRVTRLQTAEGEPLWIAAERLRQFQSLFPDAPIKPVINAVADGSEWDKDTALLEIVRSRLEGLGPVTGDQLATPLGLPSNEIHQALLALEQEGFVIQGQFTGQADTEWCERRLLARIHRYTLKRLRAEIQPVSLQDYSRFLFHWQGLDEPGSGPDALTGVLDQLEGLSLPAAAWEKEVLPARIKGYQPHWLDKLCSSGRITWLRLAPAKTGKDQINKKRTASSLATTPIALLPRLHRRLWQEIQRRTNEHLDAPSSSAEKVIAELKQHGPLFFDELLQTTRLLQVQLEEALAELVAQGRTHADHFAGLRGLLTPQNRRPSTRNRRRNRLSAPSIADGGRWSLLSPSGQDDDQSLDIEPIAWALLRRYGVVFRKLLEREAGLPPWRELLYVYRRLEARGEIRGGRFVHGFSGEQYALPEAVGSLRKIRKQEKNGQLMALSAADPLNLTGILFPGQRIPALTNNRLLFRDGLPIAALIAGKVEFLTEIDEQEKWRATNILLRQPGLPEITERAMVQRFTH